MPSIRGEHLRRHLFFNQGFYVNVTYRQVLMKIYLSDSRLAGRVLIAQEKKLLIYIYIYL